MGRARGGRHARAPGCHQASDLPRLLRCVVASPDRAAGALSSVVQHLNDPIRTVDLLDVVFVEK